MGVAPFLNALLARPATYPSLSTTERVVAEVALGGDTMMLTDRRVIVAGSRFEQTLPLAHIALVEVRYERPARRFVLGAVAILIAAFLFAIAGPVRNFLTESGAALEPAATEERATPSGQGLANRMQRLLNGLAATAAVLPILGWLALAAGIGQIIVGAIGRTIVTFTAGGGEVSLAKHGNDRALHDFVAEVGRQLPGPEATDSMVAPTVPMPGPSRL